MNTDREKLKALIAPDLADVRLPDAPTTAQRQAVVIQFLGQQPGLSDRSVAAWTGASREMVAATRRRLEAAGQIAPGGRVGCDGKVYKHRPRPRGSRPPAPRAERVRACLRAAYALSEGARLPAAVLDWITGPPGTAAEPDRRLA